MTLTLVASAQFSGSPTVKLVATSTTGSPNPIPNNSPLTIIRTHADGGQHVVLTSRGPRLIGGGWTWLDLHCPFNQAVTYQIVSNGSLANSNQVFLPSKRTWLVHPELADLAMMVTDVRLIGDRTTRSRAEKFTPIGGKPFYISDGARDGVSGSISFRVSNEAPYKALFEDDMPILINTPGTAGWDIGWMWVQPGDVQYVNPADGLVSYPFRHVMVPFDECADPRADFTPAWTSGDAAAAWATSAVMAAAYATSLDLVTDTRL